MRHAVGLTIGLALFTLNSPPDRIQKPGVSVERCTRQEITISVGLYPMLSAPEADWHDMLRWIDRYPHIGGFRAFINAWWEERPGILWSVLPRGGRYDLYAPNPTYFERIRVLCMRLSRKPVLTLFHRYLHDWHPLRRNLQGLRLTSAWGDKWDRWGEKEKNIILKYVNFFLKALRESCPHAWIEIWNEAGVSSSMVALHEELAGIIRQYGFRLQINPHFFHEAWSAYAHLQADVWSVHGVVPEGVKSPPGRLADVPHFPNVEISDDGMCCHGCKDLDGRQVHGCQHVYAARLMKEAYRRGFRFFQVDFYDALQFKGRPVPWAVEALEALHRELLHISQCIER